MRDNDVFVQLNGSIFSKEATILREELIDCIGQGYKMFTFDFNEVKDIDSTGLGVIVTIRKRVLPMGGNIFVENLNPKIREVFERTRLNRRIDLK
ncbi:STAS domain-containing protein [Desertibacillus haloalkaliphilus]|nr:STAS domain-containing protein [Desertibacillus haloalkaliphilus]